MSSAALAKADYGLDAPTVVRNLALAGVGALIAGVVANRLTATNSLVSTLLLIWGLAVGISLLVTAALMVWSSKAGKLQERERLVDSLQLHGDESVLDVGCGRGLLLNAVARRLKTGKTVGLDLWQAEDQSGNSPEAALANARAEGVADRVEVKTGNMMQIPFPDAAFDAVVSSLAIHNIYDKAGRAQAVREIARVLKPGGRVALLDFQKTDEYVQTLRDIGWENVKLSGLHWQMFPPVRVVTGRKPVS